MTQSWIGSDQPVPADLAAWAETPVPAGTYSDLVAIAATPEQFEALRDLVTAVYGSMSCCLLHAILSAQVLRNAMDRVVALGVKL